MKLICWPSFCPLVSKEKGLYAGCCIISSEIVKFCLWLVDAGQDSWLNHIFLFGVDVASSWTTKPLVALELQNGLLESCMESPYQLERCVSMCRMKISSIESSVDVRSDITCILISDRGSHAGASRPADNVSFSFFRLKQEAFFTGHTVSVIAGRPATFIDSPFSNKRLSPVFNRIVSTSWKGKS